MHILIGYVRCSMGQQYSVTQKQVLLELGIESSRIYTAQGFIGTNRARLGQALAAVRSGGMLLVSKLGRIARSLLDALAIADNLASRNVKRHSIPVSTTPLTQWMNSSLTLRSSERIS
jgi:DNA invertase Pin-like site-specific DNA recombinase